jgi:hypothetical protein
VPIRNFQTVSPRTSVNSNCLLCQLGSIAFANSLAPSRPPSGAFGRSYEEAASNRGCQGVRFLKIAARMLSSFLMQAVSATFFGLPEATRCP